MTHDYLEAVYLGNKSMPFLFTFSLISLQFVITVFYPSASPILGFPGGLEVTSPPAMQETWVRSLGWEDPLEEEMAIHSSILAWRIPIDREAWWATVPRAAKESDVTLRLNKSYSKQLVFVSKLF